MTIIDLRAMEEDVVDKWLPLVGRTEDEKVTGDVNIVVTRGPLDELQRSRSNSVSQSQEIEKPKDKEEEQRTIKKLASDLKTKSGRLEQLKESNSVLDLHVVKLKQQVENLQAELGKKNTLLESKEDALAKANAYAAELQKALQEKQNVRKLVEEWNAKSQKLGQMQITLKAKTLQFRKKKEGEGEENGKETNGKKASEDTAVVGEQEMSVEKIVEEWTEYAQLIETLEVQLKEKEEELDKSKKEQQEKVTESAQTIEKLQFDLKEKAEEVERKRETQADQTQQLEEIKRELAELQVEIKEKEDSKKERDDQLHQVTINLERLQKELAEKSTELQQQQARVGEIKIDLQVVEQLKTELKEKEDEVEKLRGELNKQKEKEEAQTKEGDEEEKARQIQNFESEVSRQANEIATLRGELAGAKLQITSYAEEQENVIKALGARDKLLALAKDEGTTNEQSDKLLFLVAQVYLKLDTELQQAKQKLEDSEKELEKEKTYHQEVVVVRSPKHQENQEQVVHEALGAQFAVHKREELENSAVLERNENGGKTEKEELPDFGLELEALENSTKDKAPLLGAQDPSPSPRIAHIHMKNTIPKTPEAAKAKQRGRACVCIGN